MQVSAYNRTGRWLCWSLMSAALVLAGCNTQSGRRGPDATRPAQESNERDQPQCSLSPADLLNEPEAEYGRMAYTEMISEDDQSWVGRFDPDHPEYPGWRLEYVSGALPTPAQQRRYQAWKADQPKGFDLAEVVDRIDRNSVRMTRRGRRAQYFGFEPRVRPGESSAYVEPLRGYVSRPTDGRCHLIVEISADDPYSPAPGVWITENRFVIVLGRRGPDDLLYPLYMETMLKGTSMPSTSLDRERRYRYSYAY